MKTTLELKFSRKHRNEVLPIKKLAETLPPAKIQDLGEMVFVHPGNIEFIMIVEFSEN
jgi:hypothetical protein